MDTEESLAMAPVEDHETRRKTRARQPVCRATVLVLIAILSVIVLIVGIILIVKSKDRGDSNDANDPCNWSNENGGAGLRDFLAKIKHTYFQLHPHKIYSDLNVLKIKPFNGRIYKPFNPKPSYLKTITDASRALHAELSNLDIESDKLQRRQQKALAQVRHYLKHTFGQVYGVNYYAGDWMMGPNIFCWNPICQIKTDIYNYLLNFKPRTLNDLKQLRKVLKDQADGIDQYISNMKRGVRAGMVRSVEECRGAINTIKHTFVDIDLYQEEGVLRSYFIHPALRSDFTSKLSQKDQSGWLKENSLTVKSSIRHYLVEYIGKAVLRLIRFLEYEHIRHCVPSSVSSGLASLPLDYEYLDQVRTNNKTTKRLPTGELLNGTKSYETSMSYFTTTSVTPDEVNKLGHEQLKLIYSQVLKIARSLTKITTNDSKAVEKFRELQDSPEYKFSQEPFPENESNAEAHKRCNTIKRAKEFCPKRWEATQKYWNEARMVINLLNGKTVPMFYFSGENITVPVCPIQMTVNFLPSSGVEGYGRSDASCSRSSLYYTPFFVETFRPRYEVWNVAAHEAIPGHHTQAQGQIEHFKDNCKDVASWMDRRIHYAAFLEGWALYAENPLISETDIYDNNLMQKYGMLKAQIWRALRLIIDTGLHYKGLTRNDSLALFNKYAWDNSDIMKKEITRYQSIFGQATAYMVGKLHIEKLRDYALGKLGEKFSLKDFHYHVLSQGTAPLEYLTSHIHKYVECRLNDEDVGCDEINTLLMKRTGRDKHDVSESTEELDLRTPGVDQLHYF